jgi:hypothetical protein
LSARNSIEQSFSISKFTFCVLVGMVSQTSLKLSYYLTSVDKIRPVSIRSDSVFSLFFADLSFRSTNSFCSLATYVLIAMSTLLRFHLPLALSLFHIAFVKGMPFGACHERMPQPVLTCASVTSVDGEFDGGI